MIKSETHLGLSTRVPLLLAVCPWANYFHFFESQGSPL